MNEKQITEIAKQHWLEEYPQGHRRLMKEGRLEKEAIAAAKLTLAEMEAQMRVGATEQEAWVASRGHSGARTSTSLPAIARDAGGGRRQISLCW